jgi:hypothetical protein
MQKINGRRYPEGETPVCRAAHRGHFRGEPEAVCLFAVPAEGGDDGGP